MKTIMKTVSVMFAGALLSGAMAASGQDTAADQPQSPPYNWPNNNLTNQIVVPTVECYTNILAAAAADKKFRREDAARKGAAGLQSGPRVAPLQASQYMEQDPKAHTSDPWDFTDTNANNTAWPGWSNWR